MLNLVKIFHEYLGCQKVRSQPYSTGLFDILPNGDVAKVADLRVVVFLDADAATKNSKGSVLGVHYTSTGLEEIDLVASTQEFLKEWDEQGFLRREGRAIFWSSCKGVDEIWVYGEEGVEVEGAIARVELEGGWMSQIISFEKEYPFDIVTGWT